MEWALLGLDQNIPYWLIRIMFMGEVEIAIKSGIKPTFGIVLKEEITP